MLYVDPPMFSLTTVSFRRLMTEIKLFLNGMIGDLRQAHLGDLYA